MFSGLVSYFFTQLCKCQIRLERFPRPKLELAYYLTFLKVVYLHRMEGENEEAHPIPLSRPYAIALAVLSFAILLIGVIFGPWFNIASLAAKDLF